MDLDFSSVEVKSIITCTVEGILEPHDLAALASGALDVDEEVEGITAALAPVENPANLKRLREKHHSVARLVASGLTQRLVAQMAGYTESYVSVLLNNPAMQELVDLYRVQYGSSALIIGEKLRSVGMKALEAIDEKFSSTQGITDVHELTAIAKLGLDRSGHGPTSSHHVISENHNIDHARIAELNQKAKSNSKEYIVPVREVRKALAPPVDTSADEQA